jgi:hypothetical protein
MRDFTQSDAINRHPFLSKLLVPNGLLELEGVACDLLRFRHAPLFPFSAAAQS